MFCCRFAIKAHLHAEVGHTVWKNRDVSVIVGSSTVVVVVTVLPGNGKIVVTTTKLETVDAPPSEARISEIVCVAVDVTVVRGTGG